MMMMNKQGLVTRIISEQFTVETNNQKNNCKICGKLKNNNQYPVVGDIVEYDYENQYILKILPRKNKLIRPNVANIDQAFIITTVKPELDTILLDKLLTIISYNKIKPIICFTKIDLLNDQELENIKQIMAYYQSINYTVITNQNKNNIIPLLKDKLSVFTGQSGSGKSTLLNNLDQSLELKIDEISQSLGRGKHTTRHTELYALYDGYVVDTPGFSSIDITQLSKIEIRDNMNEMFDNLDNCKYRDCMHKLEDGCYIKEMYQENKILKTRYENYLYFIDKGMM